jgi:hypothetical protein
MLIPRKVLATVPTCCDRENSRYALGAVLIERDRSLNVCRATASDGRRLLTTVWEEPDCYPINNEQHHEFESVLIASDDCKKLAKLGGYKASLLRSKPVLDYVMLTEVPSVPQPKTVTFSCSDGQAAVSQQVQVVEGRFPRWRDVMPTDFEDEYISVAVNPKLLEELVACVRSFRESPDEYNSVKLMIHRDTPTHRPVLVCPERSGADAVRSFGILMPMEGGLKPGKQSQAYNPLNHQWVDMADVHVERDYSLAEAFQILAKAQKS